MSDSQRFFDIAAIVMEKFPKHPIVFYGLSNGEHFHPYGTLPDAPRILVFDLTLMDIGGQATEAELLYFEAYGERFYIDENTVSSPTIPPTCEAVLSFRRIYGIVVE